MNYIQITIPTADINLQEVLTALLSEMDYEGFDQDAQPVSYTHLTLPTILRV